MENYQITITRSRALFGCALKHTVEIDGLSVGVLKNGSSVVINTVPGHHTLTFLFHGKVQKTITVLITPGNYSTILSAKINMHQKIEITQDSNTVCSPTAFFEDINGSKRKKHPLGIIASILVVLFVFVAFVSIFTPTESTPSSQTPNGTSQVEELTDEEKAALQLEDATAQFADGNYMSAIEVCNSIIAEYPNTDAAKNMNEYFEKQYAQFTHFSAKDLMAEYDSNIVNADATYTDTIMIVSGTVTSIGKTNGDNNLTVLLDSGSYFYCVQLNFKTSQTDSVAQLAEGDTVTAIGKCTGQSGKQFIVFDGKNVMIENCYLISQQ